MRRREILKRFAGLIAVFMLAAGITAASALADDDDESPRSGALHVTKECSQYNGQAGSFCTITSSNIRAIKPGMRVVYLQPLGVGVLDSDIVLSSRRRPAAFGHVVLDLATAQGRVTFSGGTGKFRGFRADVAVSVDASGCGTGTGPTASRDGTTTTTIDRGTRLHARALRSRGSRMTATFLPDDESGAGA